MKIVFLDINTMGDDIDLSEFYSLGEVVKFDYSTTEEALIRTKDADIVITNKMKKTAILLNVGRGPIINEQDLADALNNNEIAAAGLDILTIEPMHIDNPLRLIKDSRKLYITPHIAWASVEARTRLMELVCENIVTYFA